MLLWQRQSHSLTGVAVQAVVWKKTKGKYE
jgi:hypothetical protein